LRWGRQRAGRLGLCGDGAGDRRRNRVLIAACQRCPARVVLVTNEVGMGIVPENRLARHFRDIAGRVNQRLAAAADAVWLVVSGIGVKIK
jgi:adenosylcobinamide kinase/adenosylcobinamide-phosphate guanylyltransferase